MAALLEKLGVPKDVRLFFQPHMHVLRDGSLQFPFGDQCEHFGHHFHRVPFAIHPWKAGNGPLLLISFSAMECLAFLAVNRHRYTDFSQLQFMATGPCMEPPPISRTTKICLILGNDLLGRLNDIYLAGAIRGKPVAVSYLDKERYRFRYNGRVLFLREQALSLSAAEKGLGIRTGIRTAKPNQHPTFLEQLKNNSSWY